MRVAFGGYRDDREGLPETQFGGAQQARPGDGKAPGNHCAGYRGCLEPGPAVAGGSGLPGLVFQLALAEQARQRGRGRASRRL